MDDGDAQEVRLRCAPNGRLSLEFAAAHQIVLIPLDPAHVQSVFAMRSVTIDVPSCRCSMVPNEEIISFVFQGSASAAFSMRRNQFAVLAKSIGLTEAAI